MAKKQWIELIEAWGEYKPGDVAEFDAIKANPLIAAGKAKKAKKRSKPRVETATAPPAAETADAPPIKTPTDSNQAKTESGGVTFTGPTAQGATTEAGKNEPGDTKSEVTHVGK